MEPRQRPAIGALHFNERSTMRQDRFAHVRRNSVACRANLTEVDILERSDRRCENSVGIQREIIHSSGATVICFRNRRKHQEREASC